MRNSNLTIAGFKIVSHRYLGFFSQSIVFKMEGLQYVLSHTTKS